MKRVLLSFILLAVTVSYAKEPSRETLAILRQSSTDAIEAYRVYAENYSGRTVSGEVAVADRDANWVVLSRYAKALWDVYDSLEEGDSVFKYPGLLSHGTITWDEEKQKYWFGFGFRPFGPRDGLGKGAISFDLTGKVLSKSKAKYPW